MVYCLDLLLCFVNQLFDNWKIFDNEKYVWGPNNKQLCICLRISWLEGFHFSYIYVMLFSFSLAFVQLFITYKYKESNKFIWITLSYNST